MTIRNTSILMLAAVLAVSSCGVPTGPDSFENIDDISDELTAPSTTSTTTTSTTTTTTVPDLTITTVATTTMPAVPTEEVPVYFLSRGQLTSIDVAAPLAPEPNDLVLLLAAGPDGPLAGLLDTLIEPELIVTTSQVDGVLTVELDDLLFRAIPARDQREAIAQIALTFLTTLRGVGQAVFTIDGEPLTVPTAARGFTDEPVSRDDYTGLLVDTDNPTSTATTTTDPELATPDTARDGSES
jgi:hypothetical protein